MWRRNFPILIFATLLVGGLTSLAPALWLVLPIEGALVALMIISAAGWGSWPASRLLSGDRSLGRNFCLATALGLGWLSTATLVLGVSGLLNRSAGWFLITAGLCLGAAWWHRRDHLAADDPASAAFTGIHSGISDQLIRVGFALCLLIPAAVLLFAAALPPGILWTDEANAYDVLEYHLQCPREYYEAGRIEFLPHNVYASFPQQMEMSYLLLMNLMGGPYAGAVPSQLLHASCGILAVLAVWCWSKPGPPRCVAAVLIGSTPWLAYLGGIAYVENGVLFFAAVAAGVLLRDLDAKGGVSARALPAAGLCAGLSGGCKYPSLLFVVVGLGAAWFIATTGPLARRAKFLALYAAGAVLTFSPWLIRNAAFTGNPVYPFAYQWFGGKAWSAEQAEQWSRAHSLPPEHRSLSARLGLAVRELVGRDTPAGFRFSMFGPALLAFGAAGMFLARLRSARLMSVWSALIFAFWVAYTFITARFAVPLVIPLAFTGGLIFSASHARPPQASSLSIRRRIWPVLLLLLAGSALNSHALLSKLNRHREYWQTVAGIRLAHLPGKTDLAVEQNTIAEQIPRTGYAWIVGDAAVYYIDRRIHYTVVFCRDPWLDYATGRSPADALAWLRQRGVTHVVFAWKEIDRLRATYGFHPLATDEWVAQLERTGLSLRADLPVPAGGRSTRVYAVGDEPTHD